MKKTDSNSFKLRKDASVTMTESTLVNAAKKSQSNSAKKGTDNATNVSGLINNMNNTELDYDFSWEELNGCLLHKSCTCIEDMLKAYDKKVNPHRETQIKQNKIIQKQKEQIRNIEAIDEYWNDNKAYITNLIAHDLHEKHR